jgi:hypothetical protein
MFEIFGMKIQESYINAAPCGSRSEILAAE